MRRGFAETVQVEGNGRARVLAAPADSPQHQQIAESRALIGQFFADLRRALRLTLPQAAEYLQVRPEVIEALETGSVEYLPDWEETSAIVMTYTSMADVNGRPALNAISSLISFISRIAPEPRLPTITERLQEQHWEPQQPQQVAYRDAPVYQPPVEYQWPTQHQPQIEYRPQVEYQPPAQYQPAAEHQAQPSTYGQLFQPRPAPAPVPVPAVQAPAPVRSHANSHSHDGGTHFGSYAGDQSGSYAVSQTDSGYVSQASSQVSAQRHQQPTRPARIQAAGNLVRAGSAIATGAKRLPVEALNKVRQRPQRAVYAVSLPLGLLLLMMHSSIFATVSQPFGAGVRWVSSYFQEHYGPIRDGLRYVEVEDPRSRRGDKLRISGGS